MCARQVRHFVNVSVPQIKQMINERNEAQLDYESYKRRLEDMEKSDSKNRKLPVPFFFVLSPFYSNVFRFS